MSTPVGIIKKFVDTLTKTKKTGTAAADEAFKAVGAKSYSAFKSKFNTDKASINLMDDFLKEKCDIRLNNDDTGAITGSDAGGDTVKTDESIVPETAKAKNPTSAEYKSFTKGGVTFNIDYDEVDDDEAEELDDFGYSAATYLAKQKLVVKNLYNWWIPEALSLINESFGDKFTDKLANIYKFDIKFEDDGSESPVELDFDYNNGYAFEVTLRIDPKQLYTITANDKNGKLPSNNDGGYWVVSDSYADNWADAPSAPFTNYLDRLILQSMAEVALKSNIPNFNKLPLGIRSGLIELVGGYDSGIGGDSNFDYDFYQYNDIDYDGMGYTTLRYLAKQYSDGMPDGLSYNAKKTVLTATTEFTGSAIDLADFASTVKNVNASALKKGIKITGNALANSIVGGAGADSLNGGAGNDTLKGGKGNDVFIYTAGKDVIADYATGDKISIGAAISKATLDGSDVIFTIGKGTLTVKNGKDKTLSMIDSKGKGFDTVVSGTTTLTINNKTTSPVTLAADVGTADASKRTKDAKIIGNKSDNVILGGSKNDIIYGEGGNDSIIGNKGNDKIYGGYGADTLKGGAGNDTLIGGAGNDSLWGDAGADVFIYSSGGGKDVIFGFDNKDTLTLDTLDFTATYKNSAVTLKFEDGSITLKNYTATTFNINDETYQIKSNKFVKK
ncbi:MAG: hypothetical protein II857_05355 [Selenomonadaceae bacterium]|nr:hypothetical protein [Selenomonadaceae bacterium]